MGEHLARGARLSTYPTCSENRDHFSALALAACSDSPLVAPENALFIEPLASRSSKDRISIYVTNWHDDGYGSFCWAIEQANADPTIAEIVFTVEAAAPFYIGLGYLY